MPALLEHQILRIEVPVVVRVGERQMRMGEVLALSPGSIIELNKRSEDELDLMINNKQIGSGTAVKVGENFGLRVTFIGDIAERLAAMASESGEEPPAI